jgi:D-alanyl-D-alanine carboxypeptidase
VSTVILISTVAAVAWFGFSEWDTQRKEAAAWRRVGSCRAVDEVTPTVTCTGVTLVDLVLPRRFAACTEILQVKSVCTVAVNAEALPAFQAAVTEVDAAGLSRHVTEFQTVNRRRCKSASTGGFIAGCISKHSYGIAADLRPFADNTRWPTVVAAEPGLDEVVKIFERNGFRWGMNFADNPDPQHLEWIPR